MSVCRILRIVCLVLLLCWSSTWAHDDGRPAGLMADCPGMNRTTILSEYTKQSITVLVLYPTATWLGYREVRCKLNGGSGYAARHLNFTRRTMVLISGYLDNSFSPIMRSFIAHYLSKDCNVIVVETFPVLMRPYPLAARVSKPLGLLIGRFLASLTFRGLSSSQLHVIGISLGAHIASHAATMYRELTGEKPMRLTALDPAGPCFRNVPRKERLHASVAGHVDVLHTNIDGFGIADALGHVDFYANGGEYQTKLKGTFIMPCFELCSHIRSELYWLVAANNPNKFVAVRCDSVASARHGSCYKGKLRTNVLGPKTNFNRTGIYYLPTDAVPPFYLGLKGTKDRRYGVNNYLIKVALDEDMTL